MSYPPWSNFVKETLFSPWCQSGRWSTQKALNKSTFLKRYNLCDDRALIEITPTTDHRCFFSGNLYHYSRSMHERAAMTVLNLAKFSVSHLLHYKMWLSFTVSFTRYYFFLLCSWRNEELLRLMFNAHIFLMENESAAYFQLLNT